MYSGTHIRNSGYIIIFHILIFIAVAEFGATVLYYLYINHLQKIKQLKSFTTKMNTVLLKYYPKFKYEHISAPAMAPASVYEQLQEELLLADPTH